MLALHSVATSFTHLVVLRTLLGIFEAVCQPAFVYLSSMWYKREEQAATVSYWYMMNGAQQIVGGLLAYCFTLIKSPPSPIKNWQAIFISYGSFSVLWGVVVLVMMPDSPMRAKCYSEADKKLMVERVRSNQTGCRIANSDWNMCLRLSRILRCTVTASSPSALRFQQVGSERSPISSSLDFTSPCCRPNYSPWFLVFISSLF